MLKKFVIGTAQFGSKYGISNTSGKTKTNEVKKILSLLDKKIYYIDTSTNYGKAEKILGSKRKKKKQKLLLKFLQKNYA